MLLCSKRMDINSLGVDWEIRPKNMGLGASGLRREIRKKLLAQAVASCLCAQF
jgi:hypothetical protein